MTDNAKPGAAEIRRARADNPKLRERDLAQQLSISEADLVAAHVGHGARRINVDIDRLLRGLEAVGEVMALTRNESAVHEKIGVYDKPVIGERASMLLGADIDLRIFPGAWASGFAVEKQDGEHVRRSVQFFDKAGNAVHKVHLRPASNVDAYLELVDSMVSDEQPDTVETLAYGKAEASQEEVRAGADELRERWSRMTDVHQFQGILRNLKLERRDAIRMIGDDYAWMLDRDSLPAMMHHAVEQELPIMCFVGSRGCIQIHSGPIANVKPMGPWINVMDPTFHLHLRFDQIAEVWAVRKPNSDGHVTSMEAYDANGEMVIQFFGKRQEGVAERAEWRMIMENLPRLPRQSAA